MNLGKVIGTVVSTRKDSQLDGVKLLVVQHTDVEAKPLTAFTVAADGVGAGEGEVVLVVTGSSARLATSVKNKPLDATIIGIVDLIDVNGVSTYRKTQKKSDE